MILKAFSQHLHKINAEVPAVIFLSKWLRENISKKPENNVEKILNRELSLFKNKRGFFMITARSDSGRQLLESLYEFALSYDSHKFNRWLHKLKASDFM